MEDRRTIGSNHASHWVLLALIFALPLMKPPMRGVIIAADLLFLLLAAGVAVELLTGRRKMRWLPGFGALLAYLAALAPSLFATTNLAASLFKYATEFYLVGLAGLTAFVLDDEASFRQAVLAWLGGTALACAVGFGALFSFATGLAQPLFDYASFGFGSLPPGDYPRLSLTFFNANMACNYLTASLGLLLVADDRGYVPKQAGGAMFAGILVTAMSTLSAGLGGIPLLLGVWGWLRWRREAPIMAWAALGVGAAIAALNVAALALTVVPYEAPFVVRLAGTTFYASGRVMIWISAAGQFAAHPLLGIGIGMPPANVHYFNPSGYWEHLTDAHNIFLSIAAQTGVIGLMGLAAIIAFVLRRTRGTLPMIVLGISFLDVFLFQGLGGSFEDTRHIWVLLGLLIAAARLDLIRGDGNNRKAGAPSSG